MDKKPILTATENDTGQRLDNFLMKKRKQLNKSALYKLVRKGQIRINGKRVKPFQKLSAGDQVRLPPHVFFVEQKISIVSEQKQQALQRQVIFEDEDYVVIDKPAGWPVHTGTGHEVGVVEVMASAEQYKDVQLAHRLDKDTSGCLLLAKNRQALLAFQDFLKKHEVKKSYVAILAGRLEESVEVNQPLDTENRVDGIRHVTVSQTGKSAATLFSPIKHMGTYTCVACEIKSGRTHQIRVHAQFLGMPVVGDKLYGKPLKTMPRALYLHAEKLSFGGYNFVVPVPPGFIFD